MILTALTITICIILGLAGVVFFFSLLFALSKLWFRSLVKIVMEEKIKAYTILFDQLMGKVTVSAMREAMQSEPVSKNIN